MDQFLIERSQNALHWSVMMVQALTIPSFGPRHVSQGLAMARGFPDFMTIRMAILRLPTRRHS